MRKVSGIAAAVVLTVGFAGSSLLAAQTGSADKGKQVYAAQRCSMCHSIGGQGNAKGPLDDVGNKLKPEELRQWLLDPKVMAEKTKATRKPAMPSYTKLSKDDLENLLAYLQTLKK